MDDFHALFKCYLDGTATPRQREAFFALLDTGYYDNLLSNDIHNDLEATQAGSAAHEGMQKEALYRSLVVKNAIAGVPDAAAGKTRRLWLAAAITVLTVVVILYGMVGQSPAETMVQRWPPVFNGRDFLRLPDGSTVLLNKDSDVGYAFGKHGREVTLRGEARFDIKHNPRVPFFVHCGTLNTRVLGNAFSARAYPRGARIARRNEFLVFDNLSMAEAARQLAAKYHVTITFENKALENCHIQAKFFNDESLEEILSALGLVLQFEYVRPTPEHIVIGGKGCN